MSKARTQKRDLEKFDAKAARLATFWLEFKAKNRRDPFIKDILAARLPGLKSDPEVVMMRRYVISVGIDELALQDDLQGKEERYHGR
jgi:hypothetical protein